MKRLLSVALVLLVGIVPVAAVASQERVPVEHLLWDIPFGIGVEECIALVKERTGVELSYCASTIACDVYVAEVEQGITFLNHPVELVAYFSILEKELLWFDVEFYDWEKWCVSIPEGEDEVLLKEGFLAAFREVMEIYHEIKELYGTPTGGSMLILEGDILDHTIYAYSFPMRNGVLDEVLVEEIFIGLDKDHTDGSLFTEYDNVSVHVFVVADRQPWETRKASRIFLKYSAWERINEEEAYSFEGRDGDYLYREPEEEEAKR